MGPSLLAKTVQLCGRAEDQGTIDDEDVKQLIKALDDAALPTSVREENGSFQRASEEKLRTRRIVSVADRFRRSATRPTPGGDGSRSLGQAVAYGFDGTHGDENGVRQMLLAKSVATADASHLDKVFTGKGGLDVQVAMCSAYIKLSRHVDFD